MKQKLSLCLLLLGLSCAPKPSSVASGASGSLINNTRRDFSAAPLPQDPAVAISVLEEGLEDDLGRLGLSLPELGGSGFSGSAVTTAPTAAPNNPDPKGSPGSDTSAPPPNPSASQQPAEAAANAPVEIQKSSGWFRGGKRRAKKAKREAEEKREETCRQVCEVVDSICDASERICQIAERMPEGSDAPERCERAKDACERAEDQGESCGCQ